jgi:copper ion binding protein
MTCASCVHTAERALLSVPGVTAARVALLAGKAEVEGTAPAEALVSAIEDVGFEAALSARRPLGGGGGSDAAIVVRSPLSVAPAPPPLSLVTLSVGGMTCSACVHTVETALKKIPGVESAGVALLAGKAEVVCRLAPRAGSPAAAAAGAAPCTTTDVLVETIEDIGFEGGLLGVAAALGAGGGGAAAASAGGSKAASGGAGGGGSGDAEPAWISATLTVRASASAGRASGAAVVVSTAPPAPVIEAAVRAIRGVRAASAHEAGGASGGGGARGAARGARRGGGAPDGRLPFYSPRRALPVWASELVEAAFGCTPPAAAALAGVGAPRSGLGADASALAVDIELDAKEVKIRRVMDALAEVGFEAELLRAAPIAAEDGAAPPASAAFSYDASGTTDTAMMRAHLAAEERLWRSRFLVSFVLSIPVFVLTMILPYISLSTIVKWG